VTWFGRGEINKVTRERVVNAQAHENKKPLAREKNATSAMRQRQPDPCGQGIASPSATISLSIRPQDAQTGLIFFIRLDLPMA